MLLYRHEELLSIDNGVYAAMWTQQQTKLAEEEQEQDKMSESEVTDPATDTVSGQEHHVE